MPKILLKCLEDQNKSFEINDDFTFESIQVFFNWLGINNINFIDVDKEKIEIKNEDDFNYFIGNIEEINNFEFIKICDFKYQIIKNFDISEINFKKDDNSINENKENVLNNLNSNKYKNIEIIENSNINNNSENILNNEEDNENNVIENSNVNNNEENNENNILHNSRERTVINNNSYHNITVKNNNDINNTFNYNSKNEKIKLNEENKFYINENINYDFQEILNENQNIEEIIDNRIQLFLSEQIPKLINDIRKNYIEYEKKNSFLYQNLICIKCKLFIGKDEYYGCFECKNFFLCKKCEKEINHIHCMVKIKCLEQHKQYLKKMNQNAENIGIISENDSYLNNNSFILKNENPLVEIINNEEKKKKFKNLVNLFGKNKIKEITNLIIENPDLEEEDYILKLM